MALQLQKIFLGNTPSNQRKFATKLFKHLVKDYPKLILPACGQFSLAKCAIEGGYKPENIYTSDISLFSSLLGYYYAGKSIWEIDFVLKDEYFEKIKTYKTEREQIAYLILLMKQNQLNEGIIYESNIKNNIIENEEANIKFLCEKLDKLKKYYSGIKYEIADLRKVITDEYDEQTIVAVNPPAFKKGYEKMFRFDKFVEYDPKIEEFDFAKEYKNLYAASKEKKYPFLWYRYKETRGFNPKEVIYACEYAVDRFDYWLFTKPELVSGLKEKGLVDFKKGKHLKKSKYPVFTDKDEITENTKVSYVKVDEEHALYYRDLWCHRLGNTKAEVYFLGLLDGKIFATVGFHSSDLFRLKSDRIFENYGFTIPSQKYPGINRLLMLTICCEEMRNIIRDSASRINRVYQMNGLKTTCLSKYRKVKSNNGLLRVIKSEKMKDGVYKLLYDTPFHKMNFKDCVKIFLKEHISGEKEDLFELDNKQ